MKKRSHVNHLMLFGGIILLIIAGVSVLFAQKINFKEIKKQATKVVKNAGTGTKKASLSNEEIISGLKEALKVGSNNASGLASKLDGYFKNPSIKIPFPPSAVNMEKKLRAIGMGSQVDKVVLTLNRAAEDAAKEAAPVFVNAVQNMTITDGVGILKGGDNAATNYLKRSTSTDLKTKFRPVIKRSIEKVQLTNYWKPVMTSYNKIPLVQPVNPDLEAYVTDKALDGLFFLISKEEQKIRKDPAARVNDILKKVFATQ